MSHNVFLDVGRGSGIPGIICFSLFFFAPVHRMLRRRHFTVYVPFLLAYFAVFVFLMSVSVALLQDLLGIVDIDGGCLSRTQKSRIRWQAIWDSAPIQKTLSEFIAHSTPFSALCQRKASICRHCCPV